METAASRLPPFRGLDDSSAQSPPMVPNPDVFGGLKALGVPGDMVGGSACILE